MKNRIFKSVFIFALAISFVSFTTVKEKVIKVKDSKVTWIGHKVTGEHTGTIDVKEGILIFSEDQLAGGNFTIDMTTINTTDLSGGGKTKLDGHLKSADFFGVEKHPTATLVFSNVTKKGDDYLVSADLTIKNITNPVKFKLTMDGNKATTAFKVDRTKYDIKYGSASFFDGLKDRAIYDEFDLNVTLVF
ncbi:YceI family protein [Ichthyenterobacterium sp. W332]|uniref:YceI family protein n=1 Tax=Microcosmobacter mediterraneus TaxID=3075607 RepID=A0ABU2YN73_9FLAO|nr:YceI family protein [Ichthyenterobacterium sp. W332]MDT0559613.1 YceI family protein [Ichthyenterobacterium sp. W332]